MSPHAAGSSRGELTRANAELDEMQSYLNPAFMVDDEQSRSKKKIATKKKLKEILDFIHI